MNPGRPTWTPAPARNPNPDGTLAEQLAWIEAELDAAITASGLPDGWFAAFGELEVPWDTTAHNRTEILGSLLPQHCWEGGQLVQSLVLRQVPEGVAVAAAVRGAWERGGWPVSDVDHAAGPDRALIRSDRGHGAELLLDADATGLILTVRSACSVDRTMTDPTAGLSERDAFLKRERTGERR